MRLHHTNLRLLDPVASVEFYRKLGLKLVGCGDLGEQYVLYMGLPGDTYLLELTVRPSADQEWLGTPGTGHLALTVPDLDETLERLSRQGVGPVQPPFHPGGRADAYVCFLQDPSGYRVELIQGELVPSRDPIPGAVDYDEAV